MKGKFRVRVSNAKVRYDFELRRNITVVQGNSGTGKTTLFDMVAEHTRLKEKSGVNVSCDVPVVALIDIDWKNQLKNIRRSIVLIDEGANYITSKDFSKAINKSDNYYLLFTRESLYELPYSVTEIYRIKTSGKYHSLEPLYKEKKGHIFGRASQRAINQTDVILLEDTKAGYQFYKAAFSGSHIVCEAAGANSSIYNWLCANMDKTVYIIADGAAFGAQMNRVMTANSIHPDRVIVCLPESFEWLILKSELIKTKTVKKILDNTYEFADSKQYFSWEQFYTDYLVKETSKTPFKYKKGRINKIYIIENNINKIIHELNLPKTT